MKPLRDPRLDNFEMPENLAVAERIARARETMAAGDPDYAHYAFGASPFPPPSAVMARLREHAGRAGYVSTAGILALREQVSAFWAHHFGVDVDPDRVVVTPGSKQALFMILALLDGPMILPAPSWVGYAPIAKLLGKDICALKTQAADDFRITAAGLEALMEATVDAQVAARGDAPQRILILNTPNNPTGVVYSRSELEAIAAVCRRHRIAVISDEIYALVTYDPAAFASMAQVYPEATFVTSGIAKYAGGGGYRLGIAILPPTCDAADRAAFLSLGATTYTCASAPIQHAAIAAFGNDYALASYIDAQRAIHRIMTTELARRFADLPGVRTTTPAGGFYFVADLEALRGPIADAGLSDARAVAAALLEPPHRVAVVSGAALAMPPERLVFRIAAVDYDGAQVMDAYRQAPPRPADEAAFVERHAARMLAGVDRLRAWIVSISD